MKTCRAVIVVASLFTCAIASPAARGATIKKADDTTVTGPLVALENGAVVLNADVEGKPVRTAVELEDVVEISIDPAADAPAPAPDPNAPTPPADEKPEAKFVELFDGKTLKGWEGDPDIWSVRDGALTGASENSNPTGPERTAYLVYTAGEFEDFEIHFRYKLAGGLENSSGLMFRAQTGETPEGDKEVFGRQQDIGWPPGLCGALLDTFRVEGRERIKAAVGSRMICDATGQRERSELGKTVDELGGVLKENDWNEAVVVAKGGHLVSMINGEVFAEVLDEQPASPRSGVFAFQFGRRMPLTIQFKDIRVRKLGPQDTPAAPGLVWARVMADLEAARGQSGGEAAPDVVASAPVSSPQASADSTAKSSAWQVRLAGGDHASGELVAWDEAHVSLKTAHGDLAFPVKQVREIWHASPDEIAKARAAMPSDAAAEDVALARKDDQIIPVGGLVLGVEGNALKFRFHEEQRTILLDKLVGVRIAAADDAVPNAAPDAAPNHAPNAAPNDAPNDAPNGAPDAAPDDAPNAAPDGALRQSLVLGSGDLLSGKWVALDDGVLTLQTPWAAAPLKVPVRDVEHVRTQNGRLVYLSDLTPAQVEQTPYFDRMIRYRADASLTGGPIKLATGGFAKGLSVHARTVLHYDVGRRFERFRATVGFQQPEGKAGRATVRVRGDDGTVLHEIADARGDQPPVELDLPVAGVSRLSLEVDFGADQDVGDRVVWADARLLRAASASR